MSWNSIYKFILYWQSNPNFILIFDDFLFLNILKIFYK